MKPMKPLNASPLLVLACLLGGAVAFVLGCEGGFNSTDSATGGTEQCGDLLTHSHQTGNACFCDVGYDWCTSDPADFDCCSVPGKDQAGCTAEHNVVDAGVCQCEEGYTWCNDDATDYSCCATSQSGTESGSGTDGTTTAGTTTEATTASTTASETTTGDECVYQPVPVSCDPNTELAFCTNTSPECIGGSTQYHCDAGGVWVPDTDLDQSCMIDGYDFAYGCTDENDAVITECGFGPGTACAGEPDACETADLHTFCLHGKRSSEGCKEQCTVFGDDMGVTYDYGECGEQRGAFACLCCDFDEPGCGGDTGTSG